jgi:hypothetical protein
MNFGHSCNYLPTRRKAWAAIGLTLSTLTACAEQDYAASMVPYNHTAQYIDAVYVNGNWSGNAFAHSGGGSAVCCVSLPRRSPLDFSVTVGWVDDAGKEHKREVKVQPYDKPGRIKIHFLRSGEVKVFVNDIYLPHPDYPLRGEEATLRPGVPLN